MGIAALVVGATGSSIYEQRKAAKFQRKAAKLEERRAQVESARNARRATVQAQIQRSRIEATQAAAGSTSSGQQNQLSAINAQLASEKGFQRGMADSFSQIIDFQNKGNMAYSRASAYSAVAGLPSQLGISAGGISKMRKKNDN